MIELNVKQGTGEWLNARAKCLTASEAPAMMGVSKYMTRSELIRIKATGIIPEHDAATLARFSAGHEAEASARPEAESIIGEPLFPLVATDDTGKYLASSDGATMLLDAGLEHKIWNEDLAASVREGIVPDSHRWQLDHQFMVFGFRRILFMVSDGSVGKMVYCWCYPEAARIEALKAGWEQFEKDVAAYVPEESKPEIIGHAPDQLPALRIEVTGMVTASNLEQFKTAALAVFRGINTSLKTDQDFADAEKAVKFCKDAEERIEAAKAHALSQTASIDDLFKTVDAIKEEARTVRLKLEKLVKAEKESRKAELVAVANNEANKHYAALVARVGVQFSMVTVSFASEIAGLKSLASMKEKLSIALAKAKVEANAIADRIDANRKTVDDMTLFPDFAQVCTKAPEDFAALMAMRISQRKEAEERRLEAERQRIRAEEEAKARREAESKMRAEEQEAAAKAELERLAIMQLKPVEVADVRPKAANAEPIHQDGKTITLGEISTRLGFTLTANFLVSLGFAPVATERSAKLYLEDSFPEICRALVRHIVCVANADHRQAA